MKLTYNQKHDWDCLLVTIKKTDNRTYHYYEDLTVIKDGDEIIGLNIFNASQKMELPNLVDIPVTELIVENINNYLTSVGEDTIDVDLESKFVIGHVLEKTQHEDADKLSVCQVDLGDEVVQIVCGAPNVEKDQKVVVAKVGAIMPSGLYIGESTLRGVPSNGMICSKRELNIKDEESKGIYVLDNDSKVGEAYRLN